MNSAHAVQKNPAHAAQGATAKDYIAFRNRMTGSGFRASGRKEIRLLVLDGFVREGEECMAGSLQEALKKGGVGAFFRLKKEIIAAIGSEQNPNVRTVGEFALHNAEETVLGSKEFGRDALRGAARPKAYWIE